MKKIITWNIFNTISSSIINESDSSDPSRSEISERAAKIITACKIRLITSAAFFGDMVMGLEFREDRNLKFKTMATDGMKIYYDPDFVIRIGRDQVKWVICHEVMHCALRHFLRKQANPEIWNAATDYALNQLIDDRNFKDGSKRPYDIGVMPEFALGGAKDTNPDKGKFIGMSAENIYQYLLNNPSLIPPEESWNYGGVQPPPTTISKPGSGSSADGKKKGAKPGDYIAMPGGGYGKVDSIDPSTGDAEVTVMTKDEVIRSIEAKAANKVKNIR